VSYLSVIPSGGTVSKAQFTTQKSAFYRYGLAILTVAIALAIKLVLLQFKVTFPLSSSFLAAIAISFWFAGTGPGILAVVLSSLLFGFVVVPYQIQMLGNSSTRELPASFTTTLPYLLYFGLVALLMSWFSSSRRGAERQLSNAREDLERRVEERTADLRKANEELENEILERKRAEEQLRERAELLDLTHDSVFVRDIQDVITYWNRGAEVQYGWTSAEAVGQVSHEITNTVFPAPLDDIVEDLVRTGRWEGELIHTRRDGTKATVASRWALQKDEQGNSIAILETNNDITERKRAEDELHRAQNELAHVTRVMTMGELVASIAHEVNQPLGAIVTNGHACVRLLSREDPDIAKTREVVERMIRDGMRASEVIKRIRELLQKTPLEKAPLNINEVIHEVIVLASRDVLISGVKLISQLDPNLPPVLGDRIQLQQVILNLILNAKDAMNGVPSRQRVLLISAQQTDSDEVMIAVRDSGTGLDPKDIERIFDPFFTTKPDGMGLGLSISRTIIEAHGGKLWATQNEGQGATVQFTLPAGSGS
jgi:PAS domain S-box-containing protein